MLRVKEATILFFGGGGAWKEPLVQTIFMPQRGRIGWHIKLPLSVRI